VIEHFLEIAPSVPFILWGTLVTLKYTALSIFFGLILGTVLAIFKISHLKILTYFGRFYTSIFRGTPLLVQLSLIYFATPQLTGYKITAFEAGLLAFSLNSGAYISEIIRAGIQAVDKGQFEAVLSLGVSYGTAMKDIILPQAIKNILPALVNEMVDLLKESALVSVIGEMDLLRRANIVAAQKYIYFEPLILVAAVYYILVMTFSSFAKSFEKRMRRSD
jgi:His/Glu/Gln/Arg/opine family amino acid ABC transporter permease subunit